MRENFGIAFIIIGLVGVLGCFLIGLPLLGGKQVSLSEVIAICGISVTGFVLFAIGCYFERDENV